MTETIWSVLGIEPTDDERAIKRAYAARVKVTSPEADAAGYMKLRAAYERAKEYARRQQQRVLAEPESGEDDGYGDDADAPRLLEVTKPAAPAATPQQLAIGLLHASLERGELAQFLQQLEEIKAADTFASLDDQYHFVGRVAVMVQEANLEDSAWCGRVAQLLGAREHENLFTDHPRYHYAYDYLLGRYEEMRAADAHAHVEANQDDSGAPGYVHVYQVLTAPFDAERLSALTRSQGYHRLAVRLLERAKTDPGIVIPAENREWWERTSMAGQHRPMVDATEQRAPEPAAEDSFRFPFWAVGLVMFLVINLARTCGPDRSTMSVESMEKFRQRLPMILEPDLVRLSGDKDARKIVEQCDSPTRAEIIAAVYSTRRNQRGLQSGGKPATVAPPDSEIDPEVVRLLTRCRGAPLLDANGGESPARQ
jgi:hypothetical protein